MRLLIGSIGKLGFLVKQLPRGAQDDSWRVFRDEPSLSMLLRALSLGDAEIRGVFRTVRAEGRTVVHFPELRETDALRRPAPAQ